MNNRIVAIALVALLVLGAVGVGLAALISGDDPDPGRPDDSRTSATPQTATEPDNPKATKPPSPGLAPFYSQTIDWEACGELWCSTVTVPVDYRDPGGVTLDLALNMFPADDPSRVVAPLVVNPGGPGAPGTDYAEQAPLVFRAELLERFDIVGFDPRGTGDSAPVDCLTDGQLDVFLASDPDPDDAVEGAQYADNQEAFFEGCVQRSDSLIGHVTTTETARDLDVIRAVLGQNKLTYFGASYGTKLGATYAELFPKKVGRLVLDGAVDVALPSRELSLAQAGGFETALRSYVENCTRTDDDCFLGDSVDEGIETISDLVADIEAEPLSTQQGRELAIGNAFYGIVAPLYSRDNWGFLDQGLSQALDGDGSTLLLLSDFYSSREGGVYTDNSAEAIYAINCLDEPYAIGPDEVPAQYDDFERVSPTFGRVFAWGLVGCRGIQVRSTEKPLDIRGEGAAPIVVTGTTRDPATPYAWAQALAEQLASGVLITREGDGHTAYNAGNKCVDQAIEGYLIEGTVPDDGLTC
ncbi:MAG: alpha/beta hydrolase [Actinomycetota bacterium]|nr:alpha/beta hydrolase [Actinomycetota bacterium]